MFHHGTSLRLGTDAWGGTTTVLRPGRERPTAPWTPLPPASLGGVELARAISLRASCRSFAPDPIPLIALAALLRTAYGVTGMSRPDGVEKVDRSVPSAGALYPLEVSVVVRAVRDLTAGVYHFVPLADGLEQVREGTVPPSVLTYLFLGQPWAADAAVVVVLSAVPDRSLPKYGDRGYRYLLIEAGHVAQNLMLTATALGLGSIGLGGFIDADLGRLIQLNGEREFVLYAFAVGVLDNPNRTCL